MHPTHRRQVVTTRIAAFRREAAQQHLAVAVRNEARRSPAGKARRQPASLLGRLRLALRGTI